MSFILYFTAPETISCDQRVVYQSSISLLTTQRPDDLSSDPEACYCLLYQPSLSEWTIDQFMFVHRQQAEGVSIRWLSLDSDDAIHTGSNTIGIKFYYSYTGSGDPTLNIVEQLGPNIHVESATMQQNIFVFTPYGLALFLSCDPAGYYDPRLDGTAASRSTPITTESTTHVVTSITAPVTSTTASSTTATMSFTASSTVAEITNSTTLQTGAMRPQTTARY